jgi:hypothetical protein
MSDLIKRINKFSEKLEKAKIHVTQEEAERMGIKAPQSPPDEKKKVIKKPKQNKIVAPKIPKTYTPMRTRRSILTHPRTMGEEVAGQLSPKGRYTSPADIAQDVNESKRLARRITGFLGRKPEVGDDEI